MSFQRFHADAQGYPTYVPALARLSAHLRTVNPTLFSVAVLPEQGSASPRSAYEKSGSVALMRAVLDDAIACYKKPATVTTREAQRLGKEAEAWLFSDDESWPFSFINVCAALDIEPEALRQHLRQWNRRFHAKPHRTPYRTTVQSQQRRAAA